MDKEILIALIRTIIILPIVAALAYFFIKYGLGRRVWANGGRRRMRVVEQLPLGPKTAISLVEIDGKYILLSHSENNSSLIKELDRLPDIIEQPELKEIEWQSLLNKIKDFVNSLKNRKGK
ncbi:MAG: flagellar biosynthetic protein FliO [Peptococcaceae bacterium]|nr:flagellar biosynthetic protein FliO [Peptococcaceae bacterium]